MASIRASAEWHDGIAELSRLVASSPDISLCILCSERNPMECHRKAVALDLTRSIPGIEILHLVAGADACAEVGVQEALM
jgi:hypothetical protein